MRVYFRSHQLNVVPAPNLAVGRGHPTQSVGWECYEQHPHLSTGFLGIGRLLEILQTASEVLAMWRTGTRKERNTGKKITEVVLVGF